MRIGLNLADLSTKKFFQLSFKLTRVNKLNATLQFHGYPITSDFRHWRAFSQIRQFGIHSRREISLLHKARSPGVGLVSKRRALITVNNTSGKHIISCEGNITLRSFWPRKHWC